MKKIFKRLILIIIILLTLRLITYAFKSKHTIKYNINDIYIDEIYNKDKYYFNIKIKDIEFSFQYKNIFNKSKKVIKKIETYNKDDLVCIYPVLKNNNVLDIICSKDDIQYSYTYLKEELNDFVNLLIKKGYKNTSWIEQTKTKKIGTSIIYQTNIEDNTFIYIWKYNGFYSINNKKLKQINYFNNDTYLNNLGIQVNNYYVVPDYNQKYEYNKLIIFNMINDNIKTLNFKKGLTITNDYYNNGVVNNNLYVFDTDNLKQYKINIKRNKYEEVGNKNNNALYYNGTWQTRNIYDFVTNKLEFLVEEDIPNILKEYKQVYNYKDNYYYIDKDNIILYNNNLKSKTYLFNSSSINNIKLVEDTLYFIEDNTLYSYNILNGLNKLIIYDELSFNKVNRYAIYKK